MWSDRSDAESRLVSVVMTTCDRPQMLRIALDCYAHQTYPNRELIVVDDGDRSPADARAIAAAGGRLLRVPSGTPLGAKLNLGVEQAQGPLCQKMDDDDWYAPGFLEAMVRSLQASRKEVCRPTVAFLMPFLFFDVSRWELRRSIGNNIPGATLLFAREDWEGRRFRSLPQDEDVWFFLDQLGSGARALPVRALEMFLAVRHCGLSRDRGHTWTHQSSGQSLEDYLKDRPLHDKPPEALLPDWALAFYRQLHREILNPAPE